MRYSDVVNDEAPPLSGHDALFEMANLFPKRTGLPMTVWVSPRGRAQHDACIKVNQAHGNQMDIDNTAVVGIRPTPHLIAGKLSTADQTQVFAWVEANGAVLIEYWNGEIDTGDLLERLTRV